MSSMPETRYAKSGDTYIAYQVMGEGPFDLVFVPGFISHVEIQMELPAFASFFARLASFCRVIRFDKRGTGLSDRLSAIPTLEERMDDVRAVMDAAGSARAALLGFSEGGPMCIVFAATYPERTTALILYGSFARGAWAPDYPWRFTDEQFEAVSKAREGRWGQGDLVDVFMPSLAHDQELRKFVGRLERASASPKAVQVISLMSRDIDVRHVLPTISVPTLVLHRTGEAIKVENGRYLAQHIKSARYVEFPGVDHIPWVGDANAVLGEIEEFLTGGRHESEADLDRVLATVLFTDIVGSTARAVELGDREWKDLLSQHHTLVREQLQRHRGREINTSGDGFLAAFDGPARAVRCGQTIADGVKKLGIHIRAGVHTGECQVIGEDLGGIAVHIGARIGALAAPDEVLVSSTVRDLVAGSGLRFEARGNHVLKGIPGDWHLLAAI
ncbi:Adenylate cyclase, class 3 [Rhizobiales bacterium GAS191]|nr:Adenylate cyclase, class 3 [Rhizobiales bacterium GAS191]